MITQQMMVRINNLLSYGSFPSGPKSMWLSEMKGLCHKISLSCCLVPMSASLSIHPFASLNTCLTITIHFLYSMYLQSCNKLVRLGGWFKFMDVSHWIASKESVSNSTSRFPLSHAIWRPKWIAQSSAVMLQVVPIWSAKPRTQLSFESHITPSAQLDRGFLQHFHLCNVWFHGFLVV